MSQVKIINFIPQYQLIMMNLLLILFPSVHMNSRALTMKLNDSLSKKGILQKKIIHLQSNQNFPLWDLLWKLTIKDQKLVFYLMIE